MHRLFVQERLERQRNLVSGNGIVPAAQDHPFEPPFAAASGAAIMLQVTQDRVWAFGKTSN
jgi:hypothetical protein